MKTGYKDTKAKSSIAKGYSKDVNVVNTPTVKISHEPPKPMLPTLRLNTDNLSDIKNWDVGKKYTLTLEVEQISKSQGNEYELSDSDSSDKGKISANFKILNVQASK